MLRLVVVVEGKAPKARYLSDTLENVLIGMIPAKGARRLKRHSEHLRFTARYLSETDESLRCGVRPEGEPDRFGCESGEGVALPIRLRMGLGKACSNRMAWETRAECRQGWARIGATEYRVFQASWPTLGTPAPLLTWADSSGATVLAVDGSRFRSVEIHSGELRLDEEHRRVLSLLSSALLMQDR